MTGKKIKSFAGLKKGQKFIVTSTQGGHNYPLNKVLTLKRDMVAGGSPNDIAVEVQYGNNISPTCIKLVNYTIDEMKKELKTLESNFKLAKTSIQSQITFCEENGLTEFDEDLFKVLEALKVLDSQSSNIEKAKVIALLINS